MDGDTARSLLLHGVLPRRGVRRVRQWAVVPVHGGSARFGAALAVAPDCASAACRRVCLAAAMARFQGAGACCLCLHRRAARGAGRPGWQTELRHEAVEPGDQPGRRRVRLCFASRATRTRRTWVRKWRSRDVGLGAGAPRVVRTERRRDRSSAVRGPVLHLPSIRQRTLPRTAGAWQGGSPRECGRHSASPARGSGRRAAFVPRGVAAGYGCLAGWDGLGWWRGRSRW